MTQARRKKPEAKGPVTLEAWFDGSMAYSDDHEDTTPELLRERLCPVEKGWEYGFDEGVPVARKHRAVFLFVRAKKPEKADGSRCCHGHPLGTPAGDLHRGCARKGRV